MGRYNEHENERTNIRPNERGKERTEERRYNEGTKFKCEQREKTKWKNKKEKNNGKSYEFGIMFERTVIIHFHKLGMRLEFIVLLDIPISIFTAEQEFSMWNPKRTTHTFGSFIQWVKKRYIHINKCRQRRRRTTKSMKVSNFISMPLNPSAFLYIVIRNTNKHKLTTWIFFPILSCSPVPRCRSTSIAIDMCAHIRMNNRLTTGHIDNANYEITGKPKPYTYEHMKMLLFVFYLQFDWNIKSSCIRF